MSAPLHVAAEYHALLGAIAHRALLNRAGRYASPEWFAAYDRQDRAMETLLAASRDHTDNLARWADDGGNAP